MEVTAMQTYSNFFFQGDKILFSHTIEINELLIGIIDDLNL